MMSGPEGCAPAAPSMTPVPAPEAPKKLPAAAPDAPKKLPAAPAGKAVNFDNQNAPVQQQTPTLSPIIRTQPAIINNQGSLRTPY